MYQTHKAKILCLTTKKILIHEKHFQTVIYILNVLVRKPLNKYKQMTKHFLELLHTNHNFFFAMRCRFLINFMAVQYENFLILFSCFSRPIGLPVLRKVRVHNLNTQSSIQMLSISGNTIHFHCSFFTDKVNINLPVVLKLLYFSRGYGDGRYSIGLREGSTKIKTKQAREKFHRIPVVFLQSILFLMKLLSP